MLTSAMSQNLCYVRKLVLDLKLYLQPPFPPSNLYTRTNIYSKSAQKILDMVSSLKHLEEFMVFLNGSKMLKSTKSHLKLKLKQNKNLKKFAVKL